MSSPVIDSVTPAGPITAAVGSKVVVTVVGHDDDTHTVTLVGHLVDGTGAKSAQFTVPIHFVDGLTLVASVDDATPVVVDGLTVTVG